MTTKNYSERVREIKNEVLNEIKNALGTESFHNFNDRFYIHYVEGEVATTDICTGVDLTDDKDVFIYYIPNGVGKEEEILEPRLMTSLATNSLIDILERLKKEIREEKVKTLIGLVKEAGGEINFDGHFEFTGWTDIDDCENTALYGLSIGENGELLIDDTWEGDEYTNTEDYIKFSELDRVIDYVRSQVNSPEKRLALTDEQKVLVKNFVKAFNAMKDGNVGIVMDDNGKGMFAVNYSEIDKVDSSYYIDDNEEKELFYKIDFRKNPICDNFLKYYVYDDEDIYVKFK